MEEILRKLEMLIDENRSLREEIQSLEEKVISIEKKVDSINQAQKINRIMDQPKEWRPYNPEPIPYTNEPIWQVFPNQIRYNDITCQIYTNSLFFN